MPDRPRRNKSITPSRGGSISPTSESLALRGLEDLAAISTADHLLRSEKVTLHSSAIRLDPSQFGELLSVHAELVNQADEYGLTPLHFAAYGCRAEAVKQLLTAKAEVDATDSWGNTPLFYAAKEGGAHCVRLLLSAGAKPNTRNHDDETPLERSVSCRAVPMPREIYEIDPQSVVQLRLLAPHFEREWRGGDATVALELVEGGAEISEGDRLFLDHCRKIVGRPDWPQLRSGPTPETDHLELSKLGFTETTVLDKNLLQAPVPPHLLLHHAAFVGHVASLSFLLIEGGVSPDCRYEGAKSEGIATPLHVAGTTEAMLLLIKAGVDVNARTRNGFTPFLSLWFDPFRVEGRLAPDDQDDHSTAKPTSSRSYLPVEPPEKLGRFLVDHGADPSARTVDPNYPTPFHLWWDLTESTARKVLEHLLDLGFDPNPQSDDEKPIVMMVAWGQDKELLETLIEAGADPEVRNSSGQTAMLISQLNGWASDHVVELLQKYGVKLHTPEELEARKANPR